MKLSKRASSLKPSPTLAITALAKKMKADGIDVLGFGAGEPDFDTPDNIKDRAVAAIKDGFTKYTPSSGINELKDAIIEKFKRDNDLHYERDEIVVSCGAKDALFNIIHVLFDKGDEIIIPSPYWVSYPVQVMIAGATPVIISTKEETGFKMSKDDLEEKITNRTKALILNTPSNPTGAAYQRKDMEDIAEIALKHNLIIISDEIYEKIVYDDFKHISMASLSEDVKKNTIVVNGVSKTYSMTGWRIGYAAGDRDVISAVSKLQSQSISNPASISQMASVEAILGDQSSVKKMVEAFDTRRKFIVKKFNSISGFSCFSPMGSFYVFPNCSNLYDKHLGDKIIKSSEDIATLLLSEAKVAIVPGMAFGDNNYIRFSYAASMDAIEKGLKRIENFSKSLT